VNAVGPVSTGGAKGVWMAYQWDWSSTVTIEDSGPFGIEERASAGESSGVSKA
jgi:hypothetical protein